MSHRVTVIGAGINGLVAAFYLRRAGAHVTVLEKKARVGGACTYEDFVLDGKRYRYPSGASVLGMMQDFVFRDTGLDRRLEVYRAKHPSLVYFRDERAPLLAEDDPQAFAAQARELWGETGDVVGYARDLERVRAFVIAGFRKQEPPRWAAAVETLGPSLAERWIRGSARDLFDHYFTGDRMRIYKSMTVTESGPVPLDEPGTAFSPPLMASGTLFDGAWGFVKGGLWQLPLVLADTLREQGVEIVTGAEIERVDPSTRQVRFTAEGRSRPLDADALFFATDPRTAARLAGDRALEAAVARKRYRGSSGKAVLFFREPVRWKDDTGREDFDTAYRFLYSVDRFDAFERSNDAARAGVEFSASSFQVYPEGAAMRKLGADPGYDTLSVFFKDLGLGRHGRELPEVRAAVERVVLSRVENPETCFGSVLLTPTDLQETFFFPEGNIDHMELGDGQTFAARTFSSEPERAFYRLGGWDDIYYCGAGSYPCGSVAGTPGFLAANEWLSCGSGKRG